MSWWSGDDVALDLKGLNHGTPRSGASYTNGRVGLAFSFDGVDDYVQSTTWGMGVGYGDFSIVGWVRTTATNDYNTVVTLDTASPGVYITGTNGSLRLYPAAGTAIGGFNDGQFHHFAVTRLNGGISYFKDGVLIETNLYGDHINRTRFRIGHDSTWPFRGAIDEVAFFERALSASEVQSIYAAGSDGMCKPGTLPLQQFFIEAEDFDFNGGQHKTEANFMPYLGGAYAGLSATAGIDYHDPGPNEYVDYRPASQGVALVGSGDRYRDLYLVDATYRIGYCEPGEWFNYTRVFPSPARNYQIYARLSSGSGIPNAVQIDEVVSGLGTSNQTLLKIGKAVGPASGGWDYFNFVPVTDDIGNPVTVNYSGQKTIRLTILPGGSEDINYLVFVPVEPVASPSCVASPSGLAAWWPGDGHPFDLQGINHGTLRNGATYAPGNVGEGFVFDGVNDYVETALDVQPSALPNTTWECWVYPTRVDEYRRQILSCDDGGYDRSVTSEYGHFAVFMGWGVWYPIGVTPNRWQHIAVVYSTNNVEFYKDGVRMSYGSAAVGGDTVSRLHIGHSPNFGEHFQGQVDEVGIYNRALSRAEIQSIYNAGLAGRCKGIPVCPNITISPLSLPAMTGGIAYTQMITASSGAAPYTFAITAGTLPPSLTLSSNGLISGYLVSTGSFSFNIRATDSSGCSKAQSYVLTAFPPVPPCTNFPAGLVSWWRAESNANDNVGVNLGVPSPGLSYPTGKVGQTFQFFGTNSITVATNGLNVGTNDFSVEGWVKTTSVADYSAILVYNFYNPGIYIRSGGQLQLYPAGISSSNGFNDGQFHHFAVVRQGPNIAYFKDGLPAGAVTYSPMNLNEPNIYIGSDPYPDPFNGSIDELSFYNRALTSNEVQAIFANGSLGKCAGQGTGGGTPDIALSATNLDFGTVLISNSSDLTLSVSNVGTGTLTITSLATNNARFRVVSPAVPFNVATGAQVTVTLRFRPTNAGAVTGAVSIVSNDPDEPTSHVMLTGFGTATPPSPPGITFITPMNPAPGTLVTITGTNFGDNANAVVVWFGSHAGVIHSVSSTQIVVHVPLAVSGAVPVSVSVGSQTSTEFSFTVQSPPSSLRITEVSVTATDSIRMVTQPAWPAPEQLSLETSDSPLGPWWKETDVQRQSALGGQEFFTPRRSYLGRRFFRVGASAAKALPFIRYLAPNQYVRTGQSVTMLGGNFAATPGENIVRFELPIRTWTAPVTQAGSNFLVVTVPSDLIVFPTGTVYRVAVTTAQGSGNGVGCLVYPTTVNAFGLKPSETFILHSPGTGVETLAVGGGIPPYQLLPQTTSELAIAVATLSGPVVTVVANTNVNFGYINVRVQDSSPTPQQSSADVYVRRPAFAPPFTASFHTLLAGTAPGATLKMRFDSLTPEQVEVRLQNVQVELANLSRGSVLGLTRLYYSSSTYGFQQMVVKEVTAARATFDVLSFTDGEMTTIARGELIQNPPTLLIDVIDQLPESLMPTTVDQEIIFSDNVFRLPATPGQSFSVTANFTSVSTRNDDYVPLRSTVTTNFTTTGLAPGAPRIERLLPVHGEIGRNVGLRGTGFDANLTNNEVTFTGPGGIRIPADVIVLTNSELFVTVPDEAISGPVQLKVGAQTGNDFSFFVRFHGSSLLLFSGFTNGMPTAPRFTHQQPGDEYETEGEVPLQAVTAALDRGQLEMTGLLSNQQVGVCYVLNFYTGRRGTNVILYRGQETEPPQRHVFQVRDTPSSSYVLASLYARDNTNGVTFQIEGGAGLFQFNAGVMRDYQFTAPIYRPPATPGIDVTLRLETVSQQWMAIPLNEMRVIRNSLLRVR